MTATCWYLVPGTWCQQTDTCSQSTNIFGYTGTWYHEPVSIFMLRGCALRMYPLSYLVPGVPIQGIIRVPNNFGYTPIYCIYIMYSYIFWLPVYTVPDLHLQTNIRNIRTFPELPTPSRFGNNGSHTRYSASGTRYGTWYHTRRIVQHSHRLSTSLVKHVTNAS